MANPENLAISDTQDEDKQNNHRTQYVLHTAVSKQIQQIKIRYDNWR